MSQNNLTLLYITLGLRGQGSKAFLSTGLCFARECSIQLTTGTFVHSKNSSHVGGAYACKAMAHGKTKTEPYTSHVT